MSIDGISGKKLLFAALRHEPASSVPWVPYAGVHAGKLKGYSVEEVLRDGDKLFEALLAVNEVYDPDGQPVLFDLQVEAEILGCELIWTGIGPPLIGSHPFTGLKEFPDHLPEHGEGRLPMILETMRKMKAAVGEKTALYGLITGPLTLASHLRGTEIFVDMIRYPDQFARLVSYVSNVAQQIAQYYIDAGMDVIALVDPLVSQISAKHFSQYLHGPYQYLFDYIRKQRVFSSFFVCGDATRNIEVMCRTDPDSIAVDENLNMVTTKQITDRYNITLGGNIPLTTKLLLGSQQDNMKFVIDLLDSLGHRNLILSPGCDIPYDTPIENMVGCLQAVRNPQDTRIMLQNYSAPKIDLDSVEIPDYAHLEKPLIEVFTLGSDTCAACTYMLRSVEEAVSEFSRKVNVVEYKFTSRENVARVLKMGVSNLPSVYINGALKYSSIIPDKQSLVDEIKKLL